MMFELCCLYVVITYKARGPHDDCLPKFHHFTDPETEAHVMALLHSSWILLCLPSYCLYHTTAGSGGARGGADSVTESSKQRGLAFQGLAWKPGPRGPFFCCCLWSICCSTRSSLWLLPQISPPTLLIFDLGISTSGYVML